MGENVVQDWGAQPMSQSDSSLPRPPTVGSTTCKPIPKQKNTQTIKVGHNYNALGGTEFGRYDQGGPMSGEHKNDFIAEFQRAREHLIALWEELNTRQELRAAVNEVIQVPSDKGMYKIKMETRRLKLEKEVVQEVESSVRNREELLRELREHIIEFEAGLSYQPVDTVRTALTNLVQGLEKASYRTGQAILKWQRAVSRGVVSVRKEDAEVWNSETNEREVMYLWESVDYCKKMEHDMGFFFESKLSHMIPLPEEPTESIPSRASSANTHVSSRISSANNTPSRNTTPARMSSAKSLPFQRSSSSYARGPHKARMSSAPLKVSPAHKMSSHMSSANNTPSLKPVARMSSASGSPIMRSRDIAGSAPSQRTHTTRGPMPLASLASPLKPPSAINHPSYTKRLSSLDQCKEMIAATIMMDPWHPSRPATNKSRPGMSPESQTPCGNSPWGSRATTPQPMADGHGTLLPLLNPTPGLGTGNMPSPDTGSSTILMPQNHEEESDSESDIASLLGRGERGHEPESAVLNLMDAFRTRQQSHCGSLIDEGLEGLDDKEPIAETVEVDPRNGIPEKDWLLLQECAVLIQATWRGYKQFRRFQYLVWQNQAAKIIQKWWHGRRCHGKLLNTIQTSRENVKAQALWKMLSAQRSLVLMSNTGKAIGNMHSQKARKAHRLAQEVERAKAIVLNDCARIIQRIYRKHKTHTGFKALTIQRMFRGFVVRKTKERELAALEGVMRYRIRQKHRAMNQSFTKSLNLVPRSHDTLQLDTRRPSPRSEGSAHGGDVCLSDRSHTTWRNHPLICTMVPKPETNVITIQCFIRAMASCYHRNRISRHALELKLQRIERARGKWASDTLGAIVRIQAFVRGILTRSFYKYLWSQKDEALSKKGWMDICRTAAFIVGSCWRTHLSNRRRTAETRNRSKLRHTSAAQIQKVWRVRSGLMAPEASRPQAHSRATGKPGQPASDALTRARTLASTSDIMDAKIRPKTMSGADYKALLEVTNTFSNAPDCPWTCLDSSDGRIPEDVRQQNLENEERRLRKGLKRMYTKIDHLYATV